MSQILATNPSRSNPAKSYNIIRGDDGVVYCDCPAWKFRRECKHLKAYHGGAHAYVATSPQPAPTTQSNIMDFLKGVHA